MTAQHFYSWPEWNSAPVVKATRRDIVRVMQPDSDGPYWEAIEYAHFTCPHCGADNRFPARNIAHLDGDTCRSCAKPFVLSLKGYHCVRLDR